MSELATGYIPRDYTAQPLGSIEFCAPFDLTPIPQSEWKDRIDYLEETKSSLTHVVDAAGILGSYQNGLPYCWMHGTVNCLRVLRAKEGQPYRELSATAAAAQVKGFRQQGGNTYEAIPFLAKNGVPTTDLWPQNKMDRSLVTPEMKAAALENRLTEWYEMEPNDLEQKMTCLLSGLPIAAGYSWWGHLICDLKAIYRESRGSIEYGVESLNSHGERWGDFQNGRLQIWGKKAFSFDQAAPRVVRVAA